MIVALDVNDVDAVLVFEVTGVLVCDEVDTYEVEWLVALDGCLFSYNISYLPYDVTFIESVVFSREMYSCPLVSLFYRCLSCVYKPPVYGVVGYSRYRRCCC